jgi:RHS repeat-associated protein
VLGVLAVICQGRATLEAQTNTFAETKRFERGTDWITANNSFVIPLDFQKGVALSNTGDNADKFSGPLPWFSRITKDWRYHYSAGSFNNPIAVFGTAGGGSRLYANQRYHFAVSAGARPEDAAHPEYKAVIRISAYRKTDFDGGQTNVAPFSQQYISIPRKGVAEDAAEWEQFGREGFTKTVVQDGLETTIQTVELSPSGDGYPWGTTAGIYSNLGSGAYVITQTASSSDYYYKVECRGFAYVWGGLGGSYYTPMVSPPDPTGPGFDNLYTMDFEPRSPWRSTYIDQPHFDGTPLPPMYNGKSLAELQSVAPAVTNFVAIEPAQCLTLDNSPELRVHPLLDRLVSDLGNDPIALANYVLNEVGLTDEMAFDESDGDIGSGPAKVSVNVGGVNRSALMTYLEGQGSPTEQCALLIYLLRKAGVPATYMFPAPEGIKMLDTQLSKLLRIQIKGAVDNVGAVRAPELISVEYPWVAAYINNQWVHIFPWMKDTEIKEGMNLYDYMPNAYDSGYKWLRAYAYNDSAIVSLGNATDTPATLFPKFIRQTLAANHPEISLEQIGVSISNRRNYFSRWQDFPRPFSVSPESRTQVTLADAAANFDTLKIDIASASNPAKKISTGEMRMCDVLNRKLLIRHYKTGANLHTLALSLNPYRPGTTGQGSFGPSDPTLLKKQIATLALDATDDYINVTFTNKRYQTASPYAPGYWGYFLGLAYANTSVDTRVIRKGDLAAICLNVGRVTDKMLEVDAQELLEFETALNANPAQVPDRDVFQGGPAYLVGMDYYRKTSAFRAFDQNIHKVRTISVFEHGLSLIHPARVSGQLPNQGDIDLIQPAMDMFSTEVAAVGNSTIHPDSGNEFVPSTDSFWAMELANASAAESSALNRFYRRTGAIATMNLLQQTHIAAAGGSPDIQELNSTNYVAKGDTVFNGVALKNSDINVWGTVVSRFHSTAGYFTQVLITPGIVNSVGNVYRGVGALIFTQGGETAGALGANLNGAVGDLLPPGTFLDPNAPYVHFHLNEYGDWEMDTVPPSPSNPNLSPFEVRDDDFSSLFNDLANGSRVLDPAQMLALADLIARINSSATDPASRAQLMENVGDMGPTSSRSDALQFLMDPVNAITGEFYVDATDLKLNGPMPLEVRRNYGSQDLADNQFGYGWKMNYMPYLEVSVNEDLLYAAEPDGSVISYRKVVGTPTKWTPLPADNPQLHNVNHGNVGGLGNAFNAQINKVIQGPDTFYILSASDGGTRTFQVLSFGYTGTNALTRQRPYLSQWKDNRGNFYSFQYGFDSTQTDYGQLRRIVSSNGNYLGFYYDVYGHINEAYTGDGRRLYYDYDGYGDLVAVTSPDNTVITYEYEHATTTVNGQSREYSKHLVIREIKPEGRILENTYDGTRRVTEQRATVGNNYVPVRNATFVYNVTSPPGAALSGYTTILDAYNRSTRYDYDQGLITNITDPLNQVTQQTWYLPGDNSTGAYPRSLKRTIDKRGLITDFSYDVSGNITQLVQTGDLSGDGIGSETATTTTVYNSKNLVTQTTAASGVVTNYYYDNLSFPYLPTRVEKVKSASTISVCKYDYEQVVLDSSRGSYGLLQRETRALGTVDEAISEWTHDWHGLVTSGTRYSGTSDPNVAKTYTYNLRNELIEEVDAIGRKIGYAYDGRGNRIWTEVRDETGNLVSWNYDYFNGNGEIEWSDGPRYSPEDYVWRRYDGTGRKTEEMRWRSRAKSDGSGVEAEVDDGLYSTSFAKYNLFGDKTETIDPRHNSTVMTYDGIGQLKTKTYYDGDSTGGVVAAESFNYEPGGEISGYTDPVSGVTQKTYTTSGKPKQQQNPDGSVIDWRYYTDGRLRTEILRNGSYWQTVYDDVNRTVTRTFKNTATTVLASEIRVFDRRGNVVSATDGEGFTTTTSYDDLDRPKVVTGPPSSGSSAQHITTYSYDACGKVLKVKNTLNEETTTTSDALMRPVLVQVRDNVGGLVRQTSYAYTPDHHGVTATAGSGANAIASTTYTDTFGKTVVSRSGTGAFKISAYDLLGNLISSGDELGQTTLYGYDALNRLHNQVQPGGAVTTLGYNAAGDLTLRQMPGGLSWQASYNNARQLQSEQLNSGTDVTRQFGFTYYTTVPFLGMRKTATDGRGVTSTTNYDDFLRVASVATTGGLAEQASSTNYLYDRRSLVKEIGQSSTGNAAGLPTMVQRDYDGYGQIVDERVYIDGAAQRELGQTWNGAGRRTQLSRGSLVSVQGTGAGSLLTYGYRADGMLAQVGAGGQTYSFGYADNGLLNQRTNPWRSFSVTLRDAQGRPRQDAASVNGTQTLIESLVWGADSKLGGYSAVRVGAWDETRGYGYNSRGQLLTESYNPAAGQTAGFGYQFDGNSLGNGLGVRTTARANGISGWTADQVNGFGRVVQESSSTASIAYSANGNALGAASVLLRLDDVTVSGVSYNPQSVDGAWSANLSLSPGAHQLMAVAYHASGQYAPSALSSFTVTGAQGTSTSSYDGAGSAVTRALPGGRNQTLKWDAFGRLIAVAERDASNNGFDWTALYDGLGRRLRTANMPVISNVPQTGQLSTLDSWYDPQVEFLEVAVAVNGARTWKVYGPDASGSFGALQGIGGLDASILESNGTTKAYLNDNFGNAVASISGTTVTWNSTRVGSYGALPGCSALPLSVTVGIDQATVWRGKRIDETGFYYLGARYYEPQGGRFLSADPIGHASSMSLYDYAGGDPINLCDPDGRWASQIGQHGGEDAANMVRGVGDVLEGLINSLLHPIATVNGLGEAAGRLSVDLQADPGGTLNSAWNNFANGWTDPNQLARNIGRLLGNIELALAGGGGTSGRALTASEQLEFDLVRNLENPNFVIYKAADLEANPGLLQAGEHRLNLPDLGSSELNWAQNEQALQRAIGTGNPIRDLSPDWGGGFLERERGVLIQRGWQFDPQTGYWSLPGH